MGVRSDEALEAQALRNGWNIPAEKKKQISERLVDQALSEDNRVSGIAIKTLIAAERNDIAREKLEMEKQKTGQSNTSDIVMLAAKIEILQNDKS